MINKINMLMNFGFVLLSLAVVGCGAAGLKGKDAAGAAVGPEGQRVISKEAREDFAAAVQQYQAAEKMGWKKESCESVAKEFEKVADDNNNMAEALYNVGATYRKCDMKNEAKAAFNKTLQHHRGHQLSMAQLAVMELESGNDGAAEEWLRKAVGAGKNTMEVVPAYVNAATILRKKGIEKKDEDSLGKAQLNLRRALAIEAKYMPALYQLAMLYLDTAVMKNKASFLTLASLVCQQAINLNPEYGPIYHALGQIHLQKGEIVKALQAFEAAFQKDPSLFGSYMNYAAINLSFRGYEEAKTAFQKAISMNPNNYDAHIGLGVAFRGLGDFNGARTEYKKAAQIEPGRTDYIFNMGLLEMDYLNQGTVEGYQKAEQVFKKFVAKANDSHKVDPDGKGPGLSWVAKAEGRIKSCKKNIELIEEAKKEMAEMERLQKEQAKREAEMQKQLEKAKELEKKEAAGQEAPGEAAGEVEGDEEAAPQGTPEEAKPEGKKPEEAKPAKEAKK
jgi:tetratricopeptide (TPR) repeat protein